MRGFNKVCLLGNIVRDPDRPSASAPVKFTLAVGKKYKSKNGDMVEHTDFISCSAWGFVGDNILKYCAKGSPLFVEGELSTRDFDDPKTGQHRWVTEVNVFNTVFLSGGKRDSEVSADDEVKRLSGVVNTVRSDGSVSSVPSESMSLRDDALFPAEECGFGPHSPEGQDVEIPF